MIWAAQKEKVKIELWDILFCATMAATMLSLDVLHFRELIQLIFIGVSLWKISLKPDLSYGFIISRLLFLLWCFLSFLWAIYPEVVLNHMASVIQSSFLAIALMIYLTSDQKRLCCGLWTFSCVSLLLIIYLLATTSFSQILQAELTTAQRITAGKINPNIIGVCCSYSLLIVYWYIDRFRHNPLLYTLGWTLIVVYGLFSLITGSKKALFLLVVGFSLLMILKSKDAFRTILRIVLAAAFCGAVLWLIFNVHFLYETIGQRFQGLLRYLINGTGDKSTYSRGEMIHQAKLLFEKSPLLGIGLHNFKEINYYGVYAHNNYWELLVCLGVPGLVLYYLPIIYAMGSSVLGFLKNKKKNALACVLMFCFLINEYATVSYTNEVIQIILAIIFSMIILNKEQVIDIE